MAQDYYMTVEKGKIVLIPVKKIKKRKKKDVFTDDTGMQRWLIGK